MKGCLITKNGVLWYFNYEEKISIRLHVFPNEDSDIIQGCLINKDFQSYAIRNINENNKLEVLNNQIKGSHEYLLITGERNGRIRIWNIPEYSLFANFEVATEVLFC